MFMKVIAQSVPDVSGFKVSHKYQRNAQNISGLCANACYSNGYDIDSINARMNDVDVNMSRFNRVIGTGHHSIADHAFFTVYLGGISKMMAMILNSLEMYTTSERSARYTNIERGASPIEVKYYQKWKDIFVKRISEEYPEIDSARVTKLAQENARYFIDVFGPYTSMMYTASYRQWSYIVQWFDRFIEQYDNSTMFRNNICREMRAFNAKVLELKICNPDLIVDAKDRGISFLQMVENLNPVEQFGQMYSVNYKCTFSCLAQAHRHRTIRYIMGTPDTAAAFPDGKVEFYVPPIIEDMADEWLNDLKCVYLSDKFPQGMLINVNEQGNIDDFILKCKERLCGRAQHEIAMLTKDTLGKLYFNINDNPANSFVIAKLQDLYIPAERNKAKCELLGGCKEPCEFGPCRATDRLI